MFKRAGCGVTSPYRCEVMSWFSPDVGVRASKAPGRRTGRRGLDGPVGWIVGVTSPEIACADTLGVTSPVGCKETRWFRPESHLRTLWGSHLQSAVKRRAGFAPSRDGMSGSHLQSAIKRRAGFASKSGSACQRLVEVDSKARVGRTSRLKGAVSTHDASLSVEVSQTSALRTVCALQNRGVGECQRPSASEDAVAA
jgi:hypothetical protein